MYPNPFTFNRPMSTSGFGVDPGAIRFNPALIASFAKPAEAPSAGIPTWVYIAGGAALVGGAAWYFLK